MWLKCNHCGNVYNSQTRRLGGLCGVNSCTGTLVYFPFMAKGQGPSTAKLDLQCRTCGNVYTSSSGRRIFDQCGVNGCTGRLDRYWG